MRWAVSSGGAPIGMGGGQARWHENYEKHILVKLEPFRIYNWLNRKKYSTGHYPIPELYSHT